MKKLLLLPLLLLSGGCSTPQAEINARDFLTDAIPYVKIAARSATALSVQYAVKNPDKYAEIMGQVNKVSEELELLIVNGDFKPSSLTSALKVKEGYVNTVLQAAADIYSANYIKINGNRDAALALELLAAFIEGVKEGSEL